MDLVSQVRRRRRRTHDDYGSAVDEDGQRKDEFWVLLRLMMPQDLS